MTLASPEPSRRRLSRSERARRAAPIAIHYDGVAPRSELRAVGISRDDVRSEVAAGRWVALGRQTVLVSGERWSRRSAWFHAIWESGAGAALDGIAALHAGGLTGFEHDVIDIAIPTRNRRHRVQRVRLRQYRAMPPLVGGGVPRVRPEIAAIHAAQWASTDRTAALILCLVVGQRIVLPEHLVRAFTEVTRCARRRVLADVIVDICDGVRSVNELDFARLCRRYGLPPPSRQVVRQLPGGRIYLDVSWDDVDLVVEIDGGHHLEALNPMLDALRSNEVVLTNATVLRIPTLGLRLEEARFMHQVVRAYEGARLRHARTV